MPDRRRFLQQTLAATLAAALPIGAHAATGITIANAAGGLNQVMAELMRRQRFLEAFDLEPDVLRVSDGSKILGGIVSGHVNASFMSGFIQVFPAIERGAPLKIIGGGALLPALALFSADPTVRTLRDLEGKTVGTGSIGALVHQLTVTLLRKYGVDVDKVLFVNIGGNADIFRAVTAGTVAAGAGESALLAVADRFGVHILEHGNMTEELQDFTYQGAWTSERMLADARDVLVRGLAAYGLLYRFVQDPASREAFMEARRTVFPRSDQAEHDALWGYVQAYKPFAVDLALGPERLRYMQQLNLEFGVQKTMLPFERVADMSLAADALKLLAAQS